MDHPLPWLRYVDADDMSVADIDFEGLKVRNDAMDKLGEVDGFIVDSQSKRPYYVVVDSGGWFKSKHFLVPIGHARLDDDRDALVVDIPKERIERFPGFDRGQFEQLGQDDIRRMNDEICTATSGTTASYDATDPMSAAWARPEYRQPEWWTSIDPATLGSRSTEREGDTTTTGRIARATGGLQAESELERTRTSRREEDRELVTAREADPSPHFDGRAQPGDILGVETGGERTHIGETGEDENKRRIAAEREAAKNRK